MARFSLKNPSITIGGTDFSSDVSQVMLDIQQTGVTESITAGNEWAENTPSGKGRWSVTITFEVDGYSTSQVEGQLLGLMPPPIGADSNPASQPIVIKADDGAVSASNPSWTGNAVLSAYQPLGSGQVGQVVRFTQTWVGDGTLTRATS